VAGGGEGGGGEGGGGGGEGVSGQSSRSPLAHEDSVEL
jgi:hypothetical protein